MKRLRSLVTHTQYSYQQLERLSLHLQKPIATVVSDIIKAAIRGELQDKYGRNIFHIPELSEAARHNHALGRNSRVPHPNDSEPSC